MKKSFLYFVIFPKFQYLKIGKSDNIENRMLGIKKYWGDIDYENSYYLCLPTEKVFKIEKALHNLLEKYKIKNISGDGFSEIFDLQVLDSALSLIEIYSQLEGDIKLVKGIPKNKLIKKTKKTENITGKSRKKRVLEKLSDNISKYLDNILYVEKSLEFFFKHYDYIEYQYEINNNNLDFYIRCYRTDYIHKKNTFICLSKILKFDSKFHFIKINNHSIKVDPAELFNVFYYFETDVNFFSPKKIIKFETKKFNINSRDSIFKFSYNLSDNEEKIDPNLIKVLTLLRINVEKMPKKSPLLQCKDLIEEFKKYEYKFEYSN